MKLFYHSEKIQNFNKLVLNMLIDANRQEYEKKEDMNDKFSYLLLFEMWWYKKLNTAQERISTKNNNNPTWINIMKYFYSSKIKIKQTNAKQFYSYITKDKKRKIKIKKLILIFGRDGGNNRVHFFVEGFKSIVNFCRIILEFIRKTFKFGVSGGDARRNFRRSLWARNFSRSLCRFWTL